MKKGLLSLLIIAGFVYNGMAQDTNPLILTDDAHYFDFWEGTWYVVKDDNTLDSNSYFKVKRNVHPASYTEEWQFGNGAKS